MRGWLANIIGSGKRGRKAAPEAWGLRAGAWLRAKPACRSTVEGRFDSAQTNARSATAERHWANADPLSADAAASPAVRQTLRNRARYEVANNSYARGIILTLANDVTGTGPRLPRLMTSMLNPSGAASASEAC
jgi:hypothetical protein